MMSRSAVVHEFNELGRALDHAGAATQRSLMDRREHLRDIAMKRGFHAASGYTDRDCLARAKTPDEDRRFDDHPALQLRPGKFDLRPGLWHPNVILAAGLYQLGQTIIALDPAVREEVIAAALEQTAGVEELGYACQNLMTFIRLVSYFDGTPIKDGYALARIFEVEGLGRTGNATFINLPTEERLSMRNCGTAERAVAARGVNPDDAAACAVFFLRMVRISDPKRLREETNELVDAFWATGAKSLPLANALMLVDAAVKAKNGKLPISVSTALPSARELITQDAIGDLRRMVFQIDAERERSLVHALNSSADTRSEAATALAKLRSEMAERRVTGLTADYLYGRSDELFHALNDRPSNVLFMMDEGMRLVAEGAEKQAAQAYEAFAGMIGQVRTKRRMLIDGDLECQLPAATTSNAPPPPAVLSEGSAVPPPAGVRPAPEVPVVPTSSPASLRRRQGSDLER
jgi:hypothetical protein